MRTSLFDLFKIGIGPSSSHTVGPMRAAYRFAERLSKNQLLTKIDRVQIELFGSLAHTGLGHGTDRGILLGLMGKHPDTVDPTEIEDLISSLRTAGRLLLLGKHLVHYAPADIAFNKDTLLPGHSNGMRFTALGSDGKTLDRRIYYSVGGGFVTEQGDAASEFAKRPVPYAFENAADLLRIGEEERLPVQLIMLTNEMTWKNLEEIRCGIRHIWSAMQHCTQRGLETRGQLPGGLEVRRRAADMADALQTSDPSDPLAGVDWLNAWAIAVNEENAAGGRVVTAPTNGAAGIIPSVAALLRAIFERN